VERRGGEVHEQLRTGEREIRGRRPGLPHVLADRRADDGVPEAQEEQLAALGEVAVLVEDAVVREELLAVDAHDLPARADRARVPQVTVEPGRADERDEVGRGGGDLVEPLPRRAEEAGPEEQVLRGIAADRELREDDEVGAGGTRASDEVQDAVAVAVEVADDGVQLCEREPQSAALTPAGDLVFDS
jgi:hypothetical protein